jgi:hypothetical protein
MRQNPGQAFTGGETYGENNWEDIIGPDNFTTAALLQLSK